MPVNRPIRRSWLPALLSVLAAVGLAGDAGAVPGALPPGNVASAIDQEEACGGCHRGAVEASHPTGFVPERPLPPEFALDTRGRMTCGTCHDPHGGTDTMARAAARGGEFCQNCHTAAFFAEMRDGGLSLLGSAHLDARAEQEPNSLDPYSMACAGCHETNVSLPGDAIVPAGFNGFDMSNHPIGSSYAEAAARGRLHPAASLPAGMLLPGGKVSCVSCHRGYSRAHGALVRRNGRLCLDCHDK